MTLPRATRFFTAGHWPAKQAVGSVTLGFDDRHRRRVRLSLDDGLGDFMLDLARAERLGDGDGLLLGDGRYVLVRAQAEDVMDIVAAHPRDAIRIAWHLGNRHLPVQVLDGGGLRLRYDHVIEHMAHDLGGKVERRMDVFTPEPGAYEGAHAHGHDHQHGHSHSHDE
ncbi:MAG: urease accessory protein UreE [Alphaproteobacteria bacterium]|nr:urease accessory protein UreE [Alphaproteobacteria bacterium]